MTEGLDPAQVPAFPHYTLSISVNTDTVLLDGIPVPVDEGYEVKAVALSAVVARVQINKLSAVRVTLIYEDTDERWNMIVGENGEVIDLTEAELKRELAARRRRKRLRTAIIGAGAVLLLAGAGTATVALWPKPPPPVATYQLQGVGATPPAAPPSSFVSRATWSQPVAAESTAALLMNGMLLTESTDGHLEGLDPRTGEVVWRGDSAPQDVQKIRLMHWGDTEVLAASEGSSLMMWPSNMPAGQPSVPPVEVPLGTAETPHLDGEQPFVSLGDWYVAIPGDSNSFKNVQLPPGTLPINVTNTREITAVSSEKIYTVSAQGDVKNQRSYAGPKGTTRMPNSSLMLDSTHVLLGWNDATATAILDLESGTIIAQSTVSAPGADAMALIDTTTKTAVIGDLAIDFGSKPGIQRIPNSFTPTTLHGRTIFGSTSTGPATLDVNAAEGEPSPWKAYTDDDQPPAVITDQAAFTIGTQLENSTIYRLEAKRNGDG